MKPSLRKQAATETIGGEYLCGVRAGEKVRLLEELAIKDERGRPTSDVRRAGEVWTVMPPNPEKAFHVFLHEPDGFPHYWPDSKKKFWSRFEPVDYHEAAR